MFPHLDAKLRLCTFGVSAAAACRAAEPERGV